VAELTGFFYTGIQKLIPKYKCLNSGGDYIEMLKKKKKVKLPL
jgi:hypothetical protein